MEAYAKIAKADKPKTDADQVLANLDFDAWVGLAEDAGPEYQITFSEGGRKALAELGINEQDLFEQVNEDAAEWAEDRAAELVGKKWVNDQLVDNPDPQWAITDSTRDGLRDLVTQAFKDGLGPKELRDKVESSYEFSDARAATIARTEIGFAHVQGAITGWKLSGEVAGYEWALGSEHEIEDDCDLNDGEYAAIGEDFPSGDDAPPLHPNCVCALLPVLKGEEPDSEGE
jgi:SPP1 gp7 family putative phage head morphogenesis protein